MIRAQLLLVAASMGVAAPAAAQSISAEAQTLMDSAKEQGMKLSPEQAEQLAARQRQIAETFGAIRQGAAGGPISSTVGPSPTTRPTQLPSAINDEAGLLRQVEALRRGPANERIESTGLDLSIGGVRYVDPEGETANIAVDPVVGDATFLVGQGAEGSVKYLSAHSPHTPLTIGRITKSRLGYEFTGVSGVRIFGPRLNTLPDGVALWRDDALFLYRHGQGVKSHVLPNGFYPAGFQRGNVGTTGNILVRKDDRGMSNDARGVQAVGSLLGMISGKKRSDFALFDIRTAKLLPLQIENITQEDDKLTNAIRHKNNQHYFWRADWAALGKRRFAVYFSRGLIDLTVTDLDTGVTKVAMSRGLGINGFEMTPDGKGSAKLVGSWMFKQHEIPDLVAWFDGDAVTIR